MTVDTITESDVAVLEKTVIAYPKKWNVVLYNDNFTSMEIVIFILMNVFAMDHESAHVLMYDIHENGKGIAGTYSKEIAETKRDYALAIAAQNGYPLKVELEVNE